MTQHIVKCKICGESFDLNSEQGVKVNARRYAHQRCFPNGELVPMETQEEPKPKKPKAPPAPVDPSLTSLKDYVNEKYRDTANWPLIQKQIKKFHSPPYNYSYSGMEKTLRYFYDVQHNSIVGSNGGIGIIEYAFKPAYDYYYQIYSAQQNNENKSFIHQVKEYIIKPPKKKNNYKLLDWGVEEEDEE